MEQNGELYVPPTPGYPFRDDRETLAWDSEILQSFAELTHITNITLRYNSRDIGGWQVKIGSYKCVNLVGNHVQCVSPYRYYPWYIWTKEGGKIQIIISIHKNIASCLAAYQHTHHHFYGLWEGIKIQKKKQTILPYLFTHIADIAQAIQFHI